MGRGRGKGEEEGEAIEGGSAGVGMGWCAGWTVLEGWACEAGDGANGLVGGALLTVYALEPGPCLAVGVGAGRSEPRELRSSIGVGDV